ncbi:hypothetical protein CBW46_006300 [Paenibacillus xerothermodurans]|uniref:Uncharacterized protein n=1 Tax=Paenibacillus xerothermodurans TaxID=1977292 RepID=A0A2W1NR68_PAEXE|nr:hypothetical protein CBW46_006300 [Paenibacillus xerothermodurans]
MRMVHARSSVAGVLRYSSDGSSVGEQIWSQQAGVGGAETAVGHSSPQADGGRWRWLPHAPLYEYNLYIGGANVID